MNLSRQLKGLIEKICCQEWNVVLVENTLDDIINSGEIRGRKLEHSYTDRWFADPFIMSADAQKIELLVEEWLVNSTHSRIADALKYKRPYLRKIAERIYYMFFPLK